jgi:hypothetical protein
LEKRKLEGTTATVGTKGKKMSVRKENILNRFYNSNTDLLVVAGVGTLLLVGCPSFVEPVLSTRLYKNNSKFEKRKEN